MPTVEIPVRWGEPRRLTRAPAPRVVPVGDPSQILHKRPGQPRSARQLARDGCVVIPPPSTAPEALEGFIEKPSTAIAVYEKHSNKVVKSDLLT